MKDKIIGVLVICLMMITLVYAFGPHTRFNHLNDECIYYSGRFTQCQVDDRYCSEDGKNTYVTLDETRCLNQPKEEEMEIIATPTTAARDLAGRAAAASAPEVISTEPPVEEMPADAGVESYLYIVVPLILIFAFLVVLWIYYYEKYIATKKQLKALARGKAACHRNLKEERGKRVLAKCPRDGTMMKRQGTLKQGPKGGQRQMYVCPTCNYRSMKTVKKAAPVKKKPAPVKKKAVKRKKK